MSHDAVVTKRLMYKGEQQPKLHVDGDCIPTSRICTVQQDAVI
jgi:hypothetical protein